VKPLLPSSPLNDQHRNPELARRMHELHRKALFENLPYTMGFGMLAALGVMWVLWDSTATPLLLSWVAARIFVSLTRLAHGFWTGRKHNPSQEHPYASYRVLAFLDAVAWSGLGWGLTPVMQLDVAVVSISILLAIAALGVFMLYVDFITAALFITPILLPNALYTLTRQDRLGIFASLAIIGFWATLLREASRSSRRLVELLRLRVQSEQAVAAKAEALRQAEAHAEAKSRFLATMGHEMRTPMHGILGLVRLIRQRELQPDTLQQLKLIEGSGEHLVRVINDVLDFSRMEAGSLPIQRQPFDLEALLHEVVDTSQVLAQDKGLELRLDYTPPSAQATPPLFVMGDPVRLRQVLHNLIGNAIKFTAQGHITLRAVPTPGHADQINLSVEDTGIGIPVEEQSGIFAAFQQAQATQQKRLGGTGLGLTISRELCRAMSGDLKVRSTPGVGSIFTATLALPVVPAGAVNERAGLPGRFASGLRTTAPSPSSLSDGPEHHDGQDEVVVDGDDHPQQPHVLLVEDNMVNAIVAEAELSHLGVRVHTLRSGLDAVRWLRHHRTDLVLMDGDLPEIDGLTATRMVRDHEHALQRQRVPIVALSANGSSDFVERCLAAGMDDHLAKPFHEGDLARVLQRHLSHLMPTQALQNA
jgi:signal transduction histidine kinase/CheY-like chemotaxis protein